MRVINEPRVYLIGRQAVVKENLDQFLTDHDVNWKSDSEYPGEILAETAGRLCYMSFGKPRPGGSEAYFKHILESGHHSVIEHSVWTFLITDVSRSLTHELVRHRLMSYSQLSQRYVDESVSEYVIPDVIQNSPKLNHLWVETLEAVSKSYIQLSVELYDKLMNDAYNEYLYEKAIDNETGPVDSCIVQPYEEWKSKLDRETLTSIRKQARQAARSVLPNATETKIVVTANARSWRHFILLRSNRHAETEIRKLANKIYDILVVESPNIFGDLQIKVLEDGSREIVERS